MTTLLRLAEISRDSYKHTPEIYNKKNSVEVYIIRENENTIVCFRGTQETKDFLSDIKAYPRKDVRLGVRVHYGFMKCAKSVWGELKEQIKNDKNIIFTGHSLGAAEATICAAYAVRECLDVKALITYGSPRVGYSGLKGILSRITHHRCVNGEDFVTDHPYWLWGYSHVSPAKQIDKSKNRYEDHAINNYIENIKKLHPIEF